MSGAWRLLDLSRGDGLWNMAVDEALLAAVAAGASPPTFRLYGWTAPCLSLGCAQPVADLDLAAVRAAGLPLLRRASGGTAVLHAASLGYSLALPASHPLAVPDVVESYRRLAVLLLAALGRLGVAGRLVPPAEAHRGSRPPGPGGAACFAALAPYELQVAGRKLVGSSQLRRRGGVLHHATLYLTFDALAFARLLRSETAAESARLAEYLAARIGALDRALGRPVAAPEVAAALVAGFAAALGTPPEVAGLTPAEEQEARRLVAERYGSDEWTYRR